MSDHLEPHPAACRVDSTSTCRRYARGHAPHPVLVQLAQSGPDEHRLPVIVMGAVGDVVTVAAGDELRRYRNHEAARITEVTRATGPEALLNTHHGVLFLRSWPRDRGAVFSLQPADEVTESCRQD
ncbi:hypothetical protein [Geodermatophilus ruber]|uniref:Uncharacterized protein n=1 Tax=Geodermatophilus ruber TaxID=504800 RepID=A0A1I4H8H9_9ACTN|nr:hypothetical protein [Geodermatophilus ruber]SFL38544.1 hypothetical protein SAMN04488085_11084 [Geodermatophilus ruber]